MSVFAMYIVLSILVCFMYFWGYGNRIGSEFVTNNAVSSRFTVCCGYCLIDEIVQTTIVDRVSYCRRMDRYSWFFSFTRSWRRKFFHVVFRTRYFFTVVFGLTVIESCYHQGTRKNCSWCLSYSNMIMYVVRICVGSMIMIFLAELFAYSSCYEFFKYYRDCKVIE